MKKLLPLLVILLLSGCGTLLPKKVEFFQDKVQRVPEPTAKERELQRQAAAAAAEKARETVEAAISNAAPPAVTAPARDTETLTAVVSESLGPPLHPAAPDKSADAIADELRSAIAKLNRRLDEFKRDNNENAGKKIEGTGVFQIPYFLWVALVGVFVFAGLIVAGVLWHGLKLYGMTNPPVALGLNAVQAGAGFARKALAEVVQGGEAFKSALEKEIQDPVLLAKIKGLFQSHQRMEQSQDTQAIIKELTK